MTTELKACPFCGKQIRWYEAAFHRDGKPVVHRRCVDEHGEKHELSRSDVFPGRGHWKPDLHFLDHQR